MKTIDAEVPRSSTEIEPASPPGSMTMASGFSEAQKLPVAMPLFTNTPVLVRVVPAVGRLPFVACAACQRLSVGTLASAVPPVLAVLHRRPRSVTDDSVDAAAP